MPTRHIRRCSIALRSHEWLWDYMVSRLNSIILQHILLYIYIVLSEYFISMKQELLCSRDQHNLCPSDWATVWGRKNCAKRIKKAEWDFNFKRRDQEIRKLKKFKDYFCRLQMEAVECMRHDVNFYSDVAFKSFMAEKLVENFQT